MLKSAKKGSKTHLSKTSPSKTAPPKKEAPSLELSSKSNGQLKSKKIIKKQNPPETAKKSAQIKNNLKTQETLTAQKTSIQNILTKEDITAIQLENVTPIRPTKVISLKKDNEQFTSLTQDQLKIIKNILLKEKEKILQKEHAEGQFCLDKNELSDVLDEASINIQTSHELRFRNRENFYLKKVNKGLDRILRGTYGLCEDCDGPISFERLQARPTAELCITCKEESELSERSNFIQARSKSLGRALHEMIQK